jgi:hypothetical protein
MSTLKHYPRDESDPPTFTPASKTEWAAFVTVMVLFVLMVVCVLLAGCAGVHESTPVQGAEYRRTIDATGNITEQFTQGANPQTPSHLDIGPGPSTGPGYIKIDMGTSFKPLISFPPAPDYSQYFSLAIGALMFAGGIALSCYGWPQIGTRIAGGGFIIVVISLTVKEYGYLYAGAVALLVAYVAWEQYRAYKKGYTTPNPNITEAHRAAAATLGKLL